MGAKFSKSSQTKQRINEELLICGFVNHDINCFLQWNIIIFPMDLIHLIQNFTQLNYVQIATKKIINNSTTKLSPNNNVNVIKKMNNKSTHHQQYNSLIKNQMIYVKIYDHYNINHQQNDGTYDGIWCRAKIINIQRQTVLIEISSCCLKLSQLQCSIMIVPIHSINFSNEWLNKHRHCHQYKINERVKALSNTFSSSRINNSWIKIIKSETMIEIDEREILVFGYIRSKCDIKLFDKLGYDICRLCVEYYHRLSFFKDKKQFKEWQIIGKYQDNVNKKTEEYVEINVKEVNGESIKIKINLNWNIRILKGIWSVYFCSIPPCHLRMIYRGKRLRDNQILNDLSDITWYKNLYNAITLRDSCENCIICRILFDG